MRLDLKQAEEKIAPRIGIVGERFWLSLRINSDRSANHMAHKLDSSCQSVTGQLAEAELRENEKQ